MTRLTHQELRITGYSDDLVELDLENGTSLTLREPDQNDREATTSDYGSLTEEFNIYEKSEFQVLLDGEEQFRFTAEFGSESDGWELVAYEDGKPYLRSDSSASLTVHLTPGAVTVTLVS
jgi:hypothetical protein